MLTEEDLSRIFITLNDEAQIDSNYNTGQVNNIIASTDKVSSDEMNYDIFLEMVNKSNKDLINNINFSLISLLMKEDKPRTYSSNGIYSLLFYNLKNILENLSQTEVKSLVYSIINKDLINQDNKLNWIERVIDYTSHMVFTSFTNKPEIKVKLLNQYPSAAINHFRIVKDILEEQYTIKITEKDDYDVVIDGVFGLQPIANKDAYKIFINGEAVPSRVGNYNLSLGFDYLVHKNYIRYPLYYAAYGDLVDSQYKRVTKCNPNKPYFACFLVSNAASGDGAIARSKMFHELSKYKKVISGGKHLNNLGYVVGKEETYEFFSQCKFVIAYESFSSYPGYLSEKLFQSYFSGSVPLYYSHLSVQDEFNKDAAIIRQDFRSDQEMVDYIIKIDQDDQLYCKIWNNSLINDNRRDYAEIKSKIKAKMKNLIERNQDVKPEIKVRLLNQWDGAYIEQFIMLYKPLSEKYNVKIITTNDYDIVIDGVFGNLPIVNKNAFKIYYVGEAMPAKLDGYDLSLGFDYIDDPKYARCQLYFFDYHDKLRIDGKREGTCNPDKQHFACFLVTNGNKGDGAKARTELFYELSKYKKVTSGGKHLNNIDRIIPANETNDFFSQCKFTISYENNINYPGYITEKVFRSYFAGSVPIYSSDITAQGDINKNAIISRQAFKSNKEMIDYIIELDNDDEKYCQVWDNWIINNPKQSYQAMEDIVRDKMKKIL